MYRKANNGTLLVIDWPSQSLNLSIIEVVWDHLNREWNKGHPIGAGVDISGAFVAIM